MLAPVQSIFSVLEMGKVNIYFNMFLGWKSSEFVPIFVHENFQQE